jgi:hypothetical protein
MIDLGRTDRCPLGAVCESCGGVEDLAVSTVETPVGVHCVTLCGACYIAGQVPSVAGWPATVDAAGAHCLHLGIDADQMAAAMGAGDEVR